MAALRTRPPGARGGDGRGCDLTGSTGAAENAGSAGNQQRETSLAVNAYLAADKAAQSGNEGAAREKLQHLRTIQGHYWRIFYGILSANLARRRGGMDFSDDERLLVDLGVVDPRMLGFERGKAEPGVKNLLEEVKSQSVSGCCYMSEWIANRHHQLQLETALTRTDDAEDNTYESQLNEARGRVLSRLSQHFTGLPGIPLEVSESMRSGELDRIVIASGLKALKEPRRKYLLRRHNLWALREQALAKARARANSQGALRLFELLNEVYAREWRTRHDSYLNAETAGDAASGSGEQTSVSVSNPDADALMSEARQMRMRMILMNAIDGTAESGAVLAGRGPRVTKAGLADFLPIPQTFDRALAELPPVVIVPGSGRGFFAWESGWAMLALSPLVGLDDSVATAFAWLRMFDDRFNRGGALRAAYEKKFPGAVFRNDFPVDYRAWICRLSKGEAGAMHPERRAFFREYIGPDLSGPMLPPNLRNVGPQTLAAICRRLEKQVTADDGDVNLYRRLAAIYWQQGNMEAAGVQFNAAMRLAPDDGETLFAAGMFMRGQGDAEAANDCFRFGSERARDTMWGVYCQDALANIL